ncbi:DUF3562 domain-containing protein [Paraburkholderia heleia]|uniref:DUF3562 domain-containing protein n=1 Tax=Paraburkholderia heleia TaxID=634127 RepID=UPI0012ED6C0B|nr:DUF3562 domain-containing protein [Paraburkholderia heleia]
MADAARHHHESRRQAAKRFSTVSMRTVFKRARTACRHQIPGGSLVQDEPVFHDLPSGDPLNDPGVTKMVADIAQATHSSEEAVRALYVSAYETLNRDARIFCFVPLLAEKRVRKILQKHACRAR